MKKFLLLSAAALAFAASAYAQDAAEKTPAVIKGLPITAISPDGNWAVANDAYQGIMVIYNMADGTKIECTDGFFNAGYGNPVSNNGIVLANTTEASNDASYFEAGQWHALPINEETDQGYNTAHGITPDGSRICGNIGRTANIFGDNQPTVMQQPVIWNRNADGEYDMYVELPFPEKDFTGQTPQYVTALCISADGKTISGQVQDGQGFVCLPIVYTLTDEGWIYYMPQPQFTDVTLPEPPADEVEYPDMYSYATEEEIAAYEAAREAYNQYQATQPEMVDFMTNEEFEAYQAALDAYEADPENAEYPNIEDYMTEEEKAAYNAAIDAFYANAPEYPNLLDFMTAEERASYQEAYDAYEAYQTVFYAWLEAYQEALSQVPSFMFNRLSLSANGRYVFATLEKGDFWSSVYSPALFDLQEKTYIFFESEENMMSCQAFDDGSILTATPVKEYMRNAYINITPTSAEAEFTPIQDYVQSKNEALYEWMGKKMKHTYETFEPDPETWEEVAVPHVDEWITGTPCASTDMKVIATFTITAWDPVETFNYESYYLPLDCTNSKADITAKDVTVKAFIGGAITVTGEVKSVEIYDLGGQKVYSTNSTIGTINTGLQHGLYIVKTTAANGAIILTKAAF